MMPSPADLTYFLEVASTLNISRAAERLGISQPSLTLSIQRLEHSLGVSLLLRSKQGVQLTHSGKLFVTEARGLLQQWENVKTKTLAHTTEVRGRYNLGCHASVAIYSLGSFLPQLLEKHPDLEIKLMHDMSRKICEQVIQREIDIGIVVNPVKHPDLVIRKLCDDDVTFWIGKGDRAIQDFHSGSGVLICDFGMLQTQDLLKKLKKSGIQFSRVLESSSLEVITELTASGCGIGAIPARVAETALGKGLRRVPKAPIFKDEVCAIYRVENKHIAAIQTINQAIHF